MATSVLTPKPTDNRKDVRFKIEPALSDALTSVQSLLEGAGFVLHTDDEIASAIKRYLTKVSKAAHGLPDLKSETIVELDRILAPIGIKVP
tara:strand:+ start:8809 stop:9081 length:273 start_codon:yes stop_codon:yes gene_type:complete